MSTRSGDAFASDVVALRHDVEAFLRRASVPAQDVGDLAEEVIVKAWEARESYDPDRGTLREWLFGIARNQLTHYRARAYRRREQLYPPEQLDPMAPEQHSPERQMMLQQAERLLQELLAQVPEKPRAAVILHKLEELPMEEAAQRMDVKESTGWSRLRLARERLAALIEQWRADDRARGGDGRPPFLLLPFMFSARGADRPAAPAAEARAAALGGARLWKALGLAAAMAAVMPIDAVPTALDPPRPVAVAHASLAAAPPAPEPEPEPKPGPEPPPSPAVPPRRALRAASDRRPPLTGEAALVQAAQGALIMGRHAEAWQLLHEHARRYPRGQLARRRERLLRELEGP